MLLRVLPVIAAFSIFFSLTTRAMASDDCSQYLDSLRATLKTAKLESKAVSFEVRTFWGNTKKVRGFVLELTETFLLGAPQVVIQEDFRTQSVSGNLSVKLGKIVPGSLIAKKVESPVLPTGEQNLLNRLVRAYKEKRRIQLSRSFGDADLLEITGIRLSSDGTTYMIDVFRDDFDNPFQYTVSMNTINPQTLEVF